MYYCLWTTVRVFVSTVSEIKVYIYIYIPRLYSYLFLYLTGSLMLFSASGISQDDQLK